MPLTGGYRRTPVMQIGADVYCDSQCIIREIERRNPDPTLFPGGASGMHWAISQWADGPVFKLALTVVLGSQADTLPADFAADRGRLYFGPSHDLQALARELPTALAQLRGHLGWMEDSLADGRSFLFGTQAGLADAVCYHLVWFLDGRCEQGPILLAELPRLRAWMSRVADIGHGQASDLSASDALQVAAVAEPEAMPAQERGDRQGSGPGGEVQVVPEGDGGDPPVGGILAHDGREEIVIRRRDPGIGAVAVHFPRVGYRVTRADE
jgi:glutathione S-transferase